MSALQKTYTITLLLLLDLLVAIKIFAQDKVIDVDVNTKPHADAPAWYSAWWVWVVGLAVFVIIIVAIISASKKK
jgi:hypothetical protein